MKLIHKDVNGDVHEVAVGFVFAHGPDSLKVTYMPEPHKPSSSGKVCCEYENGDSVREGFVTIYDMEWIEREDQGWVHPEVALGKVLDMYKEIFNVDISGFDLDTVVDMVSNITMENLEDYPHHAPYLAKWVKGERV